MEAEYNGFTSARTAATNKAATSDRADASLTSPCHTLRIALPKVIECARTGVQTFLTVPSCA